MKQAARVKQQMEEVQAQLAARTVETTSGGGAVKGDREMRWLHRRD